MGPCMSDTYDEDGELMGRNRNTEVPLVNRSWSGTEFKMSKFYSYCYYTRVSINNPLFSQSFSLW